MRAVVGRSPDGRTTARQPLHRRQLADIALDAAVDSPLAAVGAGAVGGKFHEVDHYKRRRHKISDKGSVLVACKDVAMQELDDRVIAIAGVGGGLGPLVAQRLAEAGAVVAGTDRSQ